MSRARRLAMTANALALGYLLGVRWPSDVGRGAALLAILVVGVLAWRRRW